MIIFCPLVSWGCFGNQWDDDDDGGDGKAAAIANTFYANCVLLISSFRTATTLWGITIMSLFYTHFTDEGSEAHKG